MMIFVERYLPVRVVYRAEVSVDPDGVFVSLFLGSVWGPTPSSNTAVLLGAPVQSRRRLDNTSGGEGRHRCTVDDHRSAKRCCSRLAAIFGELQVLPGGERQVERTTVAMTSRHI